MLAREGDVLGLLAMLRSRSVLHLPPSAMDYLAIAIRQKEIDLPGLTGAAFAEIVGFATLLLIRCQLHVERRLAESDRIGGDPTHLPADLDADGWLQRVERISCFLIEVFSARARIEHLGRLNDKARQKDEYGRRPQTPSPLVADRVETAPGEAHPLGSGLRCQTGGFKFP